MRVYSYFNPFERRRASDMSAFKGRWKLISLAALVVAIGAVAAATATARSSATPIKIAVLSDCQG
ncbi:MAG: hypothetical protein M3P41_14940, partial [Actinomycetota bacterium]|nr:hypothetical protein [Actinomycetota bacterium]